MNQRPCDPSGSLRTIVDQEPNRVWVFGALRIEATLASATAIARPRFGGVILADPATIAGAC